MPVHVSVFLLVACLFLCLMLRRLDWLHLQPSHARERAKRSTLPRLLKPRTPDDCPCVGYLGYPFENRKVNSSALFCALVSRAYSLFFRTDVPSSQHKGSRI